MNSFKFNQSTDRIQLDNEDITNVAAKDTQQ
jgi:hypothetical protein